MLILSVFKNQLTILTGIVLFKIKIAPNNAESYRKHYIIYFVTSFPQKILKIDYKNPEWINKSIRLSLKKRTKLTKKYHMNPTVSNKEALDLRSQECTSLITESKDRYIAKMSPKLDNPKSVPKRYWSIINKFLSNKQKPYHNTNSC